MYPLSAIAIPHASNPKRIIRGRIPNLFDHDSHVLALKILAQTRTEVVTPAPVITGLDARKNKSRLKYARFTYMFKALSTNARYAVR